MVLSLFEKFQQSLLPHSDDSISTIFSPITAVDREVLVKDAFPTVHLLYVQDAIHLRHLRHLRHLPHSPVIQSEAKLVLMRCLIFT